jgi:hypothetical protein
MPQIIIKETITKKVEIPIDTLYRLIDNLRCFNKAVVEPAVSLCVRGKLWTAAVWQVKDSRR